MNVTKQKMILTLTAQVTVEYTEVIEVDSDMTKEQLDELRRMRRRDVSSEDYVIDLDSFSFDRSTLEEVPEGDNVEYDAIARIRDGEVWFHPVAKDEVKS